MLMAKALAALSLEAAIVTQSAQPTFRARIDVVPVDVIVVDRTGAPVRGLMPADFLLRDRGTRQTIATFDELSHDTAAAPPLDLLPASVKRDVSSNQTAQSGRLIVLVVDDLHIYKERTDRAKEIARDVIAQLGTQSSMAVLFTSGEHSTLVTEDRSLLGGAIDTLKGRQSWRRPHQATDGQKGARIDPEAGDALGIVSANQETKVQDFFDNMAQYKTLQDAARLLGGGDAPRTAVGLMSEGIGKDLSGIFGAMAPPGDVPEGGVEYAMGAAPGPSHVPPTPYHDTAMIDMMEAMRRSNVATYAIDPRGRVDSKDLAREGFPPPAADDSCSQGLTDWVSPVRQAQHGLEMISDASGGFAVTNTD